MKRLRMGLLGWRRFDGGRGGGWIWCWVCWRREVAFVLGRRIAVFVDGLNDINRPWGVPA